MKSLSVSPSILWVKIVTSTRPQGQTQVGVVTFVFGQAADLVDKPQPLGKIREKEGPEQMVLIDDFPVGQLVSEPPKLYTLQRGHAAAAGNAAPL